MKKIIFLIIITSNTLSAQNLVEYTVEEVNWKKWDLKYEDNQAKVDFINAFTVEKRDINGASNTLTPSDAKLLDIDGDGSIDMIYLDQGTFWIYLNRGDSLIIAESINEQIFELSKAWPDAPLNFSTANFGCCENGDWEINYYQFFIKDGQFHYQIYRTEMIAKGTNDLFRNMPPTQIKIGSSSADLVLGPGSPKVITSYETERSGYATASIKDESGTLWWKVFIKEPGFKLRTGWIERNKLVPVYQNK